jgi:hypothetical protein
MESDVGNKKQIHGCYSTRLRAQGSEISIRAIQEEGGIRSKKARDRK